MVTALLLLAVAAVVLLIAVALRGNGHDTHVKPSARFYRDDPDDDRRPPP